MIFHPLRDGPQIQDINFLKALVSYDRIVLQKGYPA